MYSTLLREKNYYHAHGIARRLGMDISTQWSCEPELLLEYLKKFKPLVGSQNGDSMTPVRMGDIESNLVSTFQRMHCTQNVKK
jgi:hypothetical protein